MGATKMNRMFKQTNKQTIAGLQFETIMLTMITLIIIGTMLWFRQIEYLIGTGIGSIYMFYGFTIYVRWKHLEEKEHDEKN